MTEKYIKAYEATNAREEAGQVAEKYSDRYASHESVRFAEAYVRRVWELIARDHDGTPLPLDGVHGMPEALAFHAMTGVAKRSHPFNPEHDKQGKVIA